MPTAYVYSPVTGNIHARNKYCLFSGNSCQDGNCTGSGANHGACSCCGGSSPVDIDTSDGGIVRFYSNSSAVKSIKTFIHKTGCCGSGCGDINRTVKVEMYGFPDGTCYIGAVVYAHIANPQVSHGALYVASSKTIGYAPAGSCGCYGGSHAHIERVGGTTVLTKCCCQLASAGATPFYSWPNCNGGEPDGDE